MKTRSRSARKTHGKQTNRARTRARRTVSIRPVAVETSARGTEAAIPVSVRGEGSSAEALIPVEASTSGKTRRRAALVPIAVQRRSAHTRNSAHTRRRRARTRREQAGRRRFEAAFTKPWRTFAGDAVSSILDLEQAALELGVDYGQTAVAVLQSMLWPILGRPVDVEPVGRSRVLAQKTPAQVAGEAMARAA